ncbi:hypothetical protein JSQ81_18370 [Sporosarcina sp. Marseille-Q4063]|uniref:hypothetical protein n=1 Tax=Sporosarcina sp. Marseille-Q4063 TaxID=2810514 RepID=UPI001BAEE013|nr:hypothetical protein [Sporosarcina sp. Marseille-Q4063]QUW21720.1 hypothetical protein JSQ81_18370 [Sporosarcina sp. Marseille-Q4063]
MDIWTIPFIIVVIIISTICILSVQKSSRAVGILNEKDAAMPEAIEDHPFTLNPIFWIILVATLFVGIIIFYYAFSFR